MLSHLVDITRSSCGAIMLSIEEDVPMALCGSFQLPATLTEKQENTLFSGDAIFIDDRFFHPVPYQHVVTGYIALEAPECDKKMLQHLLDSYAHLASKELELADQTAELQYQNEIVSRKQKQLEEAIAFKNNILSLTTHDLRSPLNAVMGFLDMMDEHIKEQKADDEIKDFHKRINRGINDIADLVEQLNEIALLELQRIELKPIKVDLNWIAQEVVDVMQGPAVKKKHTLNLHRDTHPLFVEVDIPKAKRILFNLISNAVKYTPSGGIIDVNLFRDQGMAHAEIVDNGIGIPEEKQKAIFEPFHKIQGKGTNGEKATGLGLFVSNYFVELFKGSISVESEPGEGASFTLHLPLTHIGF
jgi:signal transduction histidine kinase